MAGWDESRHKEWDMMHTAGLTVREIADHCHQHDNTVRLHLHVRERYQSGLRAEHESSLAGRGSDRPTTGWRRRLREAQDFLAEQHRPPSRHSDVAERSLYIWIASQRHANKSSTLSSPKLVLLATLPGWNLNPRENGWNERWHQRLTQLREYVAETGVLPHYKRHTDENERVLGIWLHSHTQAPAERRLLPRRHEALDAAIPGWDSTM